LVRKHASHGFSVLLAETLFNLQRSDMVEVVVRERVGDGELLSFAFELLGGVFK